MDRTRVLRRPADQVMDGDGRGESRRMWPGSEDLACLIYLLSTLFEFTAARAQAHSSTEETAYTNRHVSDLRRQSTNNVPPRSGTANLNRRLSHPVLRICERILVDLDWRKRSRSGVHF